MKHAIPALSLIASLLLGLVSYWTSPTKPTPAPPANASSTGAVTAPANDELADAALSQPEVPPLQAEPDGATVSAASGAVALFNPRPAPPPVAYRAPAGHWETRRSGLLGRQSYTVWVTGQPQPRPIDRPINWPIMQQPQRTTYGTTFGGCAGGRCR